MESRSEIVYCASLQSYYGKRILHSTFLRSNYNHIMPLPSTNLAALCREGRLKEALHILLTTNQQSADLFTYLQLLQTCILNKSLPQGKKLHSFFAQTGFTFVLGANFQNKIMNMYVKCGSLVDARRVFGDMEKRDKVSWNMIIGAYRRNGNPEESVTLFQQMQRKGVQPDHITYASVLPACAKIGALEQGIDIHQSIKDTGFLSNSVVVTALIDMYAKCGSIDKARDLFDRMPRKDVISWTTIIAGYAQNGLVEKALETFKQMKLTGVEPNSTTFVSILPACVKMGALKQGMGIHQSITEAGFLSDAIVASSLVDMYAKCGCLDKAKEVFDRISQKDVVSWNAMISGYVQNEFVEEALKIFTQMQSAGIKPNSTTLACILPACAKMGALEQGIDIHQSIIDGGFLLDSVVASALVHMYAKCGSIDKASELFERIPQRDVVSWNALIVGYSQNGHVEKAIETLKQMRFTGVKPDTTTFASILPACAKIGALEYGIEIHQRVMECGFLTCVVSSSALVDMYAKCGSIGKARELFDKMPERNVISWNALIAGYVQNGFGEKALESFEEMRHEGIKPYSSTLASIIPACTQIGELELGRSIHQIIIESGFFADIIVGNSLVNMYAKCGSMHKACELFDKMPERNVVSWTAMIVGYAQNGFVEKALETFKQMQVVGVKPNCTTFASVLPACAKMGALEQGIDIHQSIIEGGFLSDAVVVSALVDMYAKCGSIDKARELFDKIPEKNVVSWNGMIAGYAHNGFCKDVVKIFELMKHCGVHPDIVSFSCVLFACSHAGLVDEGCTYFSHMSKTYCITPTVDHYVCMVDLLSRTGYLEDTLNFIIKMPIKPVVVVWMCFLGACRSHMNMGLGVFTATLLFDLDPKNAAAHVLLSHIYADIGRWGEVQMVRRLMKDKGIKKIPGCSWIEEHKMVHSFHAGDRSHPQTQEIYAKLEELGWEMKASGYNPESRYSLNDVEEEEKELFLCHHSEKLAIAFGLLNMPPRTTIRVVKNLRVCVDCHTAVKFISKIVAREIVVRDVNRFHHFKQGQCSCGDFW